MNSFYRLLPVFALAVSFAGCGGVEEVPPPESGAQMTPEEEQNKEKQMEMMREAREKQQKGR